MQKCRCLIRLVCETPVFNMVDRAGVRALNLVLRHSTLTYEITNFRFKQKKSATPV